MQVRLEDTVMRSPDVLEVEMEDVTIVLTVVNGRLYGLSRTSREIWRQLAKPMRVSDLCDRLTDRYAAPRDFIEAGTLRFLTRFANAGVVHRTVD